MTKHTLYLLITLGLIISSYLEQGIKTMLIALFGVIFCGTMIFFSRLWAEYIIPFGFSATKASDYSHASDSAPAVVFLGWVLFVAVILITLI